MCDIYFVSVPFALRTKLIATLVGVLLNIFHVGKTIVWTLDWTWGVT